MDKKIRFRKGLYRFSLALIFFLVYTLTQPGYGFFAARGYQNFHTRNCSRLVGKSNIRGFDTFSHACRAGYTPCKYCKPSFGHLNEISMLNIAD